MRVLNDYHCTTCGTTKEHFVDNEMLTIGCHQCGDTATKVRSVPNFQLPGNDPAGFPTAHARWEKKREQKIALEKRAESSH